MQSTVVAGSQKREAHEPSGGGTIMTSKQTKNSSPAAPTRPAMETPVDEATAQMVEMLQERLMRAVRERC